MHASRVPYCYGQSGRSSDSPPFLGLELDSILQQICLSPNKLREILGELIKWQSCRKTTKQKLLSLIGKLAFAARAFPAGRLFIRHLITLSMKVKRLHHRIRLNSDAQADIAWWQECLPTWNGTAQFVDQQPQMQQRKPLAHMDAVRTSKVSGFTMTGNHISSFRSMCLSNGKNSLQLLLQLSPGVTFGSKSTSDFSVTTSRLLICGKANLPSILKSCPCCARFFSQRQK